MIIVTGAVTAAPENFEALRRESLAHVLRSRAEDGCLLHSVHADVENPRRLVFLEKWRDRAALEVHFRQEGSGAFMRVVRAVDIGRERMETFEVEVGDS